LVSVSAYRFMHKLDEPAVQRPVVTMPVGAG
jgi:hypothetical protein